MRALEEKAFALGVSAEALMEEAGAQIARAVQQFFPFPDQCQAVFGKGNNGGDALVAARHLAAAGWTVHLIPAYPANEWGALTKVQFARATGCELGNRDTLLQATGRPLVILDGLLGIGAKGDLREPLASFVETINHLRQTAGAQVVALDIPTGLDGDTGALGSPCIVADFTLAIGFAKCGLVADSATSVVSRLAVLPLGALSAPAGNERVATGRDLVAAWPRRNFDSHKGDHGRISIVAGSPGFTGAAVLCATAAVRAGAGLVTLHAANDTHATVAAAVPPEVMVRRTESLSDLLQFKQDVIAIGPGFGMQRPGEVLQLIEKFPLPMIVDADALNILSHNLHFLASAAGARVLTPHPGEMARLDPGFAQRNRSESVRIFNERFPAVLLLKGARTVIGQHGQPLSYNSTGNPGMGTGGMGDVLTGVIAALIGQKASPYDAARLGAWLCGRAAEQATSFGCETEETLTPTRLLDYLARAFTDLRSGCF